MSVELIPTDVLDASALLVFLNDEPGSQVVEHLLDRALISSVNWSQVFQKVAARGGNAIGLRGDMSALGLRVEPFTADDAEAVARLWPTTKSFGLSLADRACIDLGIRRKLPVWTADRNWAKLALPVSVQLVR